jgi:hypothetical protein
MGIGSLDLDEALRTYRLVAASSLVQVRRIIEEADGAFCCILVQKRFDMLSLNIRVFRKLNLSWNYFHGRRVL